jgi:hypothetical protein
LLQALNAFDDEYADLLLADQQVQPPMQDRESL